MKVEYGKFKLRFPVTVVDGPVPTLLGRDWLKKIKLDWESIFSQRKQDKDELKSDDEDEEEPKEGHKLSAEVFKLEEQKVFETLKIKYPEVFRKCLRLWKNKQLTRMYVHVNDLKDIFPEVFSNKFIGCLKNVLVHIPVSPDVIPRFFIMPSHKKYYISNFLGILRHLHPPI